MNVDYSLLGDRIKKSRKQKHLTQEEMSEQLGVTVGYISQIERGITKPNLEMLSRISACLECDLAFCISGVNGKQPHYLEDDLSEKFSMLSPEQKRFVLKLIDLLLQEQK